MGQGGGEGGCTLDGRRYCPSFVWATVRPSKETAIGAGSSSGI